jgi:hypothetical protein
VLFFLVGCNRNGNKKKDIRQVICEDNCKCVLSDSRCSPKSKAMAEKVLKGWADPSIDPVPVLVHAAYMKPRNDKLHLSLTMSDEEFDVIGIIIREMDASNNLIIEERYPMFIWDTIGYHQYFSVAERKPGDKKDTVAWDKYQSDPNMKDNRPTIYISIPQKDAVQVNIAVYDKKGNQSEFMPLESFLYKVPKEWLTP